MTTLRTLAAVPTPVPTPASEVAAPSPRLLARVLITVVGFYRIAVSPLRPPCCRYRPTCSEYAVEAFTTWGAARGGWLALRRLLRCHPWHAGGYDPVPRPAADLVSRAAA